MFKKVWQSLPPLFDNRGVLSTVGPAYRCDNHTEFDCKTNYRCVPLWSVCNGHNDCRDNSDEQGCGESVTTILERQN